jgi:hypothetical protein
MKRRSLKLKARDIVPGWPRSRRTSGWEHYEPWFFMPWYREKDERFFADAQADYEYHQAQQLMVTAYLEEQLDYSMFRAGIQPRRLPRSSRLLRLLEKKDFPAEALDCLF